MVTSDAWPRISIRRRSGREKEKRLATREEILAMLQEDLSDELGSII
jgi:hypothetical protein